MKTYKKTPLNPYPEDCNISPRMSNEYPFWITEYGTTFPNPSYQEIRYNSGCSCIEYIISGSGVIN